MTTTDERFRSNAITAAPALLTLIPGVVYGPEYLPYTLSPWILYPCVIALLVAYGGLFLWLFHRGGRRLALRRRVWGAGGLTAIAGLMLPLNPDSSAAGFFLAALWLVCSCPWRVWLPGWALFVILEIVAQLLMGVGMGIIFLYPGAPLILIIGAIRVFTGRQRRGSLEIAGAVTSERSRLALDIHDTVGQTLTAAVVKLQVAGQLFDSASSNGASADDLGARARREMDESEELVRRALTELRALIGDLHDSGLARELDHAEDILTAAGITPVIPRRGVELVPESLSPVMGWVVREAVTNVVRHSGADECRIRVESDRIIVTDDGRGPGATDAPGTGTASMTKRVRQSGGTLRITATEPTGTRVEARWS
ncbi:sensor histidine kinase [Corynebacterium sp. CCM 9204]|uniref:sensor histidine kinase n=1 Tax=Corynebacterium sp. CCM 9204 TaxID=3057616 RepID=UPI003523A581